MNPLWQPVVPIIPYIVSLGIAIMAGVMSVLVVRQRNDDRRDEREAAEEFHGDVPSLPEGWPGRRSFSGGHQAPLRTPAPSNPPSGGSSGTPPLTEGYVVKGGHNKGPSQIQDRPPAPAAITRSDAEVAANFRAECERLESLGYPVTNTPRAGESDAQTAARARRG